MLERILPLVGIFLWCAIAWFFSNQKKRVPWGLVVKGLIFQAVLTISVLGIPALGFHGPLEGLFSLANDGINAILGYTMEGSRFIFGGLMDISTYGFIFAFQVLPTIIFMSTVMAVLYHIGIMQWVVGFFAWLMQKTFRTSGAETLSTAANIFLGQTEAPLIIRPFLAKMTQSELFCVMVGGMASVAGGVLAAYVGLLQQKIPGIAGHLLIASILSAPATLIISKIMHPETETPETLGQIPEDSKQKIYTNTIEAAASGASEGLSLAMNVAGMLLAFIALIALVNGVLGQVGHVLHFDQWGRLLVPESYSTGTELKLSFQLIMSWIFAPFSLFMGIPWSECMQAGSLLGEKTVLNEFVAYLSLSSQTETFSERSNVILSYALCGFANFSSIAIQIGGIGGMAPSRRGDLAAMGLRCVLGGTLCTFLIASTVAILV